MDDERLPAMGVDGDIPLKEVSILQVDGNVSIIEPLSIAALRRTLGLPPMVGAPETIAQPIGSDKSQNLRFYDEITILHVYLPDGGSGQLAYCPSRSLDPSEVLNQEATKIASRGRSDIFWIYGIAVLSVGARLY